MRALLLSDLRGGSGWISSVDVRAKIAISLMASVATIALDNPASQLVLFATSMAYALSMRRFKLLAAAYGICIAMLVIATGFAWLIARLAGMKDMSLLAMAVPFLRLGVMVNVILPLAFSTRLQALLAALKGMRLPFFIYIPLSVMIRFIPTFISDLQQIHEALRIRGYALSWKRFVRQPVLSLRFITAPMLFRSLKASEDLGVAAELKGLGANRKMCPYKSPVWKLSDTLLMVAAFLAAGAAVGCMFLVETPVSMMGGMR